MTRVSALVPTYDRADHVCGAIETVLAQTYEDCEAVVVNDGSTDSTADVLAEYEENDRVQVHHNERNRGIAFSFNRAAREADGELLCILGDDDRWHPRKVERQVSLIDSLPPDYGVLYTGGVATRNGRIVRRYRPDRRGCIYPDVLSGFDLSPHSSHMIRREAFEAVGGFDPGFPHGVDWEMNVRLAKRYRYEYLPDPLVERRLHGENVSLGTHSQAEIYGLIRERFDDEIGRYPGVERTFRENYHRFATRAAFERNERRKALGHCMQAFRVDPRLRTAALFVVLLFGRPAYRIARRARRAFETPDRPPQDEFEARARRWWTGASATT